MTSNMELITTKDLERMKLLSSSSDMTEFSEKRVRVESASHCMPLTIYTKLNEKNEIEYYTSSFFLKSINSFVGHRGLTLASDFTVITGFRKEDDYIIGSPDLMIDFAKKTVATGGKVALTTMDGLSFSLPKFITYMYGIPGFEDAYEQYCLSPDEGVTLSKPGKDLPDEFVVRAASLRLETEPGTPYTASEYRCIAFILILFMSKKVENDTQYQKVMEKRISAFCFATMARSVVQKKLSELFIKKDMSSLPDYLTFYPKLKMLIYQTVLSTNSPANMHIKVILRDTQMTLFNFIHTFLVHPKKTKLHINHRVLVETRIWLRVYRQIYNTYGDYWRFFKLFEPQSTLTSVNEFESLASAALSFISVHVDLAGTSRRIVGRVKETKLYTRLACQMMPESFLKGTDSTSLDYEAIVKEFNDSGVEIGYSLTDVIKNEEWSSIEKEVEAMHRERAEQSPDLRINH